MKNNLLLYNSHLIQNRHIRLLVCIREINQIHPIPEQETMRRPPEMEHTQLITLVNMLALLHGDIASRDLSHTHTHERHGADGRVIGLDEDDRARRQGGQVGFRGDDALAVDVRAVTPVEARVQGFGVVGAVDDVGFDDTAGDGRVPAVVAQGVQEGLVDGAADELVGGGIAAEHVGDRVRLLFHPELVAGFDVALDLVGAGLAGVDDDAVVVGLGDGADPWAEEAGEEVVPGFEAVMGG